MQTWESNIFYIFNMHVIGIQTAWTISCLVHELYSIFR